MWSNKRLPHVPLIYFFLCYVRPLLLLHLASELSGQLQHQYWSQILRLFTLGVRQSFRVSIYHVRWTIGRETYMNKKPVKKWRIWDQFCCRRWQGTLQAKRRSGGSRRCKIHNIKKYLFKRDMWQSLIGPCIEVSIMRCTHGCTQVSSNKSYSFVATKTNPKLIATTTTRKKKQAIDGLSRRRRVASLIVWRQKPDNFAITVNYFPQNSKYF